MAVEATARLAVVVHKGSTNATLLSFQRRRISNAVPDIGGVDALVEALVGSNVEQLRQRLQVVDGTSNRLLKTSHI